MTRSIDPSLSSLKMIRNCDEINTNPNLLFTKENIEKFNRGTMDANPEPDTNNVKNKSRLSKTVNEDTLSTVGTAEESAEFSISSIASSSRPVTPTEAVSEPFTASNAISSKMVKRVSFSEKVTVRNHLHASDISDNEKSDAWFAGPDYHSMFKENSKIIRTIPKLTKKQEKKDRKKKAKQQQQQRKVGGKIKRGSLAILFGKKKSKNKKDTKQSLEEVETAIAVAAAAVSKSEDDDDSECIDSEEYEQIVQAAQRSENQHQYLEREDDEVSITFGDEDDDCDVSVNEDIEEEERRGYSIRGLENEIVSKRRLRDQVYLQAKCTVLSIQQELVDHMDAMPQEFINCCHNSRVNSNNEVRRSEECYNISVDSDDDDDDDSLSSSNSNEDQHNDENNPNNQSLQRMSLQLERAAQQYHDLIAERYNGICEQHAKDARERGIRDAMIARQISKVSSSLQEQNHHRSFSSLSSSFSKISKRTKSRRWSVV